MHLISQILFAGLSALAIFLFAKKIRYIRSLILLGKDDVAVDQPGRRWRNVLLLAFGQKKMFQNPLVALLHFVIYAGFIIINIEVLEIVLDGLLGTHRLFLPLSGSAYTFLIDAFEVLAAGVLTVCIIFLVRRNLLKVRRLASPELDGWPRSDANYILISEIILMSLFLTMNGADQALQAKGVQHYVATGPLLLSQHIAPMFEGMRVTTLTILERSCWWLHIAGIYAFLNYLPYSKHLHILFAFPNAYYAPLDPPGKMTNMPEVQQEVLYALQPELAPADAVPPAHFGAKDVTELSWKNLLDAYSCTECGRCTAACPANITGKKLSPRKIMMATRDRLEDVGQVIRAKGSFDGDGKSLLHDYIGVEALRACTTCQACVQACPVSISPLSIIHSLRRSLIMEESNAPQEWNTTFSNMENNFAPWKFSPDDRDQWTHA
jgi:ferredoxin